MMENSETCKSCTYLKPISKDEGFCRRFPPMVYYSPIVGHHLNDFPTVHNDMRCGEYIMSEYFKEYYNREGDEK